MSSMPGIADMSWPAGFVGPAGAGFDISIPGMDDISCAGAGCDGGALSAVAAGMHMAGMDA